MAPADRAYLDALYRDDILRTQELTGLDLSDWLSPDYQEPMRREGGGGTDELAGSAQR